MLHDLQFINTGKKGPADPNTVAVATVTNIKQKNNKNTNNIFPLILH